MLRKKICLQRLFESACCTAVISELVQKRIPDGRTGVCYIMLRVCYISVIQKLQSNIYMRIIMLYLLCICMLNSWNVKYQKLILLHLIATVTWNLVCRVVNQQGLRMDVHTAPRASVAKAKAGMVHSVSGWTRGVQVKLWDPLRTRAIPERLRGVFTTRRYTNPRLPYFTSSSFMQRLWTACSHTHT